MKIFHPIQLIKWSFFIFFFCWLNINPTLAAKTFETTDYISSGFNTTGRSANFDQNSIREGSFFWFIKKLFELSRTVYNHPPERKARIEFQNGFSPNQTYDGAFANTIGGPGGASKFVYQKLFTGNRYKETDYRALIKFDLSDIPSGVLIENAYLELFSDHSLDSRELNVGLYKILSDWSPTPPHNAYGDIIATEGLVVWEWASKDISSWYTPGGDFNPEPVSTALIKAPNTWYNWEISSLVQDWVDYPDENYGAILKDSDDSGIENWKRFRGARVNYQTQTRPKLIIEYSPSIIPNQEWNSSVSLDDVFDLDHYFQDPDNDILTYTASVIDNPQIDVRIDSSNKVTFSSPPDWYGTETVTFFVDDGYGGKNHSNTVQLTVWRAVEIPNQRWQKNIVLRNAFNLDDYFSEAENFTVSTEDNPNINVIVHNDHNVSFVPINNFSGSETVVFTTENSQGLQKSYPVYLTVESPENETILTEHPRIFINSDNKPFLMDKIWGPLSNAFNVLKTSEHEKIQKGRVEYIKDYVYKQAYLYQMTGEERFASNTIAAMEKVPTWVAAYARSETGEHSTAMETLAIGFDWVYDQLSKEQKEYFISLINSYYEKTVEDLSVLPDFHNYGATAWIGLLISGLATYGENDKALEYMSFARDIVEYGKEMPKAFYHLKSSIDATGGAMNWEGPTYSRRTMFNIFKYAEALRTAHGDKVNPWTSLLEQAEEAGYYILYMTRPDHKFQYSSDSNYPGVSYFEITNLCILANQFKNGHFKQYIDQYYHLENNTFVTDIWPGKYMQPLTYYLLWYDPSLGAESLDTLPSSGKFGDTVVIRNGFGQDDTMITIKAGPHWGFHSQMDHGTFTIFKKQPLAIDSGYYDSWSRGKSHNWNYWKRTIAHNTLLIKNDEEVWPDWPKGTTPKNDGGQRWAFTTFNPPNDGNRHSHNRPFSGYDMDVRYDEFGMGKIERFETNENIYDYVKVDLTNAYNNIYAGHGNNQPEKVHLVQREFVYLYDKYLIVFDKINAVKDEFKKSWLLHSGSYYDKSGEPFLNGTETLVQGDLTAGIFESANTDLVTIEREESKLFCKTLLPESHLTRKIGGSGFEFWVDGSNEPLSVTNIPEDRLSDDPGAWRFEVQPLIGQKNDLFLHILQPEFLHAQSMVDSNLISSSNMSGAFIADTTNPSIVLFSKTDSPVHSTTYRTIMSQNSLSKHFFFGLAPGIYSFQVDGRQIKNNLQVSANGSLLIEHIGGEVFALIKQ